MKHINFVLFVSIIFFAVMTSQLVVNAYVNIGPKWYWIFTNPLQYYDTSGFEEVATARSDWNNAVSDIQIAPGEFNCLYKIKYDYKSDVLWDGLMIYYQFGGYFLTVDIFINDYYVADYTSNQRKSVIAHEMGHAFGLGDRYEVAVLMNGVTNGPNSRWGEFGISTPQSDDISGVNNLY